MSNDHKTTHQQPSRLIRIPHIEYYAVFKVGSVKQLPLSSDIVVIDSVFGVQYTLHNWKQLAGNCSFDSGSRAGIHAATVPIDRGKPLCFLVVPLSHPLLPNADAVAIPWTQKYK